VPTRPSQTDPARAENWARHKAAVGAKIHALRHERGLTLEELAHSSGVSLNVLLHVEHGRRGLLFERLYDIARALGVEARDLLPPEEPARLRRRRKK
jgi:transcriptional regulator with XRE-family HTH domain